MDNTNEYDLKNLQALRTSYEQTEYKESPVLPGANHQLIIGEPGSGKSLHTAKRLFDYMNKSHRLKSPFDIFHNGVLNVNIFPNIIEPEQIVDILQVAKNPFILFLDEISSMLESMRGSAGGIYKLTRDIRQFRHVQGSIWGTTTHERAISYDFLELTKHRGEAFARWLKWNEKTFCPGFYDSRGGGWQPKTKYQYDNLERLVNEHRGLSNAPLYDWRDIDRIPDLIGKTANYTPCPFTENKYNIYVNYKTTKGTKIIKTTIKDTCVHRWYGLFNTEFNTGLLSEDVKKAREKDAAAKKFNANAVTQLLYMQGFQDPMSILIKMQQVYGKTGDIVKIGKIVDLMNAGMAKMNAR